MRVSIGILARNEERSIGNMLRSTMAQTIFAKSCPICLDSINLVVVANGCTDNTAAAADRFLAKCSVERSNVDFSAQLLERGDKANAWNVFVHELSPANADVLVLLDADIEFASKTVLETLLAGFEKDEQAKAVTDVPTARIDRSVGLLAALASRIGTKTGDSINQHAIAGSCYAARASVLRGIVIPPGLPVEDGFVRACVVTGGFKHPDISTYVRVEPTVRHYYTPAATLSGVFHHQVRLTLGSLINSVLFDTLWREASAGDTVATVVRRHLENDPKWVSGLLADHVQKRGRWVIPKRFVFRRIERLRSLPITSRLRKWPLTLITTAFDVVVCWRA